MKRKIISFFGLALFVGAVAFNMHLTNSNIQANDLLLKNVEALASSSCPWGYRNWDYEFSSINSVDCGCTDRHQVRDDCPD